MAVVLDIGNTHTRVAVWENSGFVEVKTITSTELDPTMIGSKQPIFAASVNPEAAVRIKELPVKFLHWKNCQQKLDFSLVDPTTIGPDRIANAIALAELFPLPGAVFDCGTAITLEVVDCQRRFVGGAIAPGRKLLRQALFAGGALLPKLPFNDIVPEQLGANTLDAMSLGIDRGVVGTFRELLFVAKQQMQLKTVLITGGDQKFFANAFPDIELAPPDFTLQGIYFAFNK